MRGSPEVSVTYEYSLERFQESLIRRLSSMRDAVRSFLHAAVLAGAGIAAVAGGGQAARAESGYADNDVLDESVDVAEVNHFYDEQGRLVFDQVIFYDWCRKQECHNIRAWRLIKNPAQIPVRNWVQGGYTAIWEDGLTMRKVRAESLLETWSQRDPELEAREKLPKEKRKEFRTSSVRLPAPRSPSPVLANEPTENADPVELAQPPVAPPHVAPAKPMELAP